MMLRVDRRTIQPATLHGILIAEATVVPRCLSVVARLAQGLPVGGVPKQLGVAAMRLYVVGYC